MIYLAIWCYAPHNDVARFTRNDVMFAVKCGEATYHKAKPSSLVKRHHLPKANIIEKSIDNVDAFFWRRHPDLNWGIRVLQTRALPLGYDAVNTKDAKCVFCKWSGRRDSNSRRSPWQGDALPLSHSRIMVPPTGIEPVTHGFSVHCSTNWATEA